MSTRRRRGEDNKQKSRVIKIDDSSDSDDNSNNSINNSKSKTTKVSQSNSTTSINSENGHNKKPDLSLVAKLESITGLSRNEAIELLKACDNDINMAISIQLGTEFVPLNSCTTSTNGTNKKTEANGSAATASNLCEDNVRAPIPQKTEKLIDYDPYAVSKPVKRTRSVFECFRNLQEELGESDDGSSKSKKRQTLAQLFRPPIDIVFSGSFDSAKTLGCKAVRWILLNIQNMEEFECQCLNRDLWSDETVKEIIKANFIFIQVNIDNPEGQKLINYYNVHSYPFIGVIDPRTGEKVAQWSKLDSHLFCELVTNFLADHELPMDGMNDSFSYPNNNNTNKLKNEDYDNEEDDDNEASKTKHFKTTKNLKNGETPFSPKLPDLKYLSFSERFENNNGTKSPKKLNSKQVADEILKNKKSTIITNNHISSSSSSEDDEIKFKIANNKNNKKEEEIKNGKDNKKETNGDDVNKKPSEIVNNSVNETSSNIPKIIKYETNSTKKDCHLRIMMPNGNRLDFITDGDAHIKILIDYLKKEGYTKPRYELIERTFTISGEKIKIPVIHFQLILVINHETYSTMI